MPGWAGWQGSRSASHRRVGFAVHQRVWIGLRLVVALALGLAVSIGAAAASVPAGAVPKAAGKPGAGSTAKPKASASSSQRQSKPGHSTGGRHSSARSHVASRSLAPRAAQDDPPTDPPGPPFTCTVPAFFLAQGTPRTQLYTGVYEAGTATIAPLGPDMPGNNSLGFDTQNGYLYAMTGNNMLQIDSRGNASGPVPVTGLSLPTNAQGNPLGTNVGAFDDSGNYWVMTAGQSTVYRLSVTPDITAAPPTLVTTRNLNSAFPAFDFTYANGFMWGMQGARIYRLNLNNGNVLSWPAPSEVTDTVANGQYGAAWTYGNGNLGFSSNFTGDIFQISVANPNNNVDPGFAVVAHYVGPESSNNDGAACVVPSNVDMAIQKTGPAHVARNGRVEWTLTVTNNGPGNSGGFVVNDTVPSEFSDVASPTQGCEVTDNHVRCSLGAMANGGTASITVTATASAAAGTCVTNTATVLGQQHDPNDGNNSADAQTCVVGLELTKSPEPDRFSAPDTPIDYTYTVHNPSNVTVTGISVMDNTLSSVDCGGQTTLGPGASMECTATLMTTQPDVDAGEITNRAEVTGQADGIAVSDVATATVKADQSPNITVKKSANISSFNAPNTEIEYTYSVKNTGNVTLNPVTVTDEMAGESGIDCGSQLSLAPGKSMTCTATYITTQDDVNAGGVTNTAEVTGRPPSGSDVSADSKLTIKADQSPSISVTKSGIPPSYAVAGTHIEYEYEVRNTGNVTLDPVTLTDSRLGTVTCPEDLLAPGDFMTCDASHAITRGDIDRGQVRNTASVTGQPPSGSPVSDTSRATVRLDQVPSIGLAKLVNVNSYSATGTPITYAFVVVNNGNVTLRSIQLSDNRLGSVSCPRSVLRAGARMVCTATHTTTQADLDRGSIRNRATVTGTTPSGATVNARSAAAVSADQLPAITVKKTAAPARFDAADTAITYSYEITNSGNVTLNPVRLSDNRLGTVSCARRSLAPGGTMTCTANYTTTQADMDRGSLSNTGTVTGTAPNRDRVRAESTLTLRARQRPAVTVRKIARPSSFSRPGTQISYTYTVTNSGNVTLSPVRLVDDRLGRVCSATSLSPGSSMTCRGSYTTTQDDVDNGGVTNTATARATGPGGQRVSDRARVTVAARQRPAIRLRKAATYTGFDAERTSITYEYLVRNTGNVTLRNISVTDSRLGNVTCPPGPLAPRAFVLCTADYTTTQADVDNGGITNRGTATGVAPDGTSVDDDSTLTIPAKQNPAITVVKSASVPSFAAPGTVITYRYLVTNTGNLTLTEITLTDDRVGPVSCPDSSLAPGAGMTCTATSTTSQADVNAGRITNTATVSGRPPTGAPVTGDDELTVPARLAPAIGILKLARPVSFAAPGRTIRYRYLVTNSGNVTLDPVTVSDDRFGSISCPQSSLAPGVRMTCTATHTTTQRDEDAGGITNTGTAVGTTPRGTRVRDTSSVTVTARQHPSIRLRKSSRPRSFAAAGTMITYRFRIINTGNVTLTTVGVGDGLPGLSTVDCPGGPSLSLAPGASVTCSARYRTTQADLDAGSIVNLATAGGTTPGGSTVTDQSTATVTGNQQPAIKIVKSATPDRFDAPGTVITYHYKVTNTGNVTLDPMALADDQLGAVSCPNPSPGPGGALALAPGDSVTCTADYTTSDGDVDHGNLANTATATGTPPSGNQVTDTSSLTVSADQKPAISVLKSANTSGFDRPGATITYRYLVTNTGNVTLQNVSVTDPKTGLSAIDCPATSLTPGQSMTCTAGYTTTQADVDHGKVRNTGTTTGTAPDGTKVTGDDSRTVGALQAPVIGILKSASVSSFQGVGTAITYRYQVTNKGNVTLDAVTVSDSLTGLSSISCPHTRLAPAASMICTARYTTTQADVDRGRVDNTGQVTTRAPSGEVVSAQQPHTIVGPTGPTPPPPTASPTPPPPTTSPTAPPPTTSPTQAPTTGPTSPPPSRPGLPGTGLSAWATLLAILGLITIAGGTAIIAAARRGR